ncbi:MAG: hypothetical protein M3Y24_03500 [Acidobacteriota bacterium]|nr:hypothetical protein [Acidobacteriota bacterium]
MTLSIARLEGRYPQVKADMAAELKNIRVNAEVFTALHEAAAPEHKTVDEMAGEAVMAGLRSERLIHIRSIVVKGQKYGAASGITEEQVAVIINAARLERDQ